MDEQQAARRRPRNRRRPLQVIAVLTAIAVLLGCADRLQANIGAWGLFVWWAVVGIVTAAWPLAFLVHGVLRVPRGGRAVYSTAFGITLSSIGLLQIGWGLVLLLAPEYTVGWYFPARGGNGTEIDDVDDALAMGRRVIALGVLCLLAAAAIAVAVARHAPEQDSLEKRRKEPKKPKGPTASPAAELGAAAGMLMVLCGALFWVVSLGIGLISMIQYDGIRQRLAECLPGVRSCATEIWVANELPWVLAVGSVVALLALGVAVWTSSSWLVWPEDGTGNGAGILRLVVGGGIFHAGSVLALSSAILFARWSDSTCTGRGSLRACGARPPEFSFIGEWGPWVSVWALTVYAVGAYVAVFGVLAFEMSEPVPREREGAKGRRREGAREDRAGAQGSAALHVTVYLLAVTLLCGAGWSVIRARHLAEAPTPSADSWQEHVERTMSTAEHPHLEDVTIEIPSGRDPEIPVTVQITLAGEEPEMPAAEARDLLDAACSYVPSPWRATTAESTWVRVTYRADGGASRFVLLDCGADQRVAVGELLTWMEQHPAGDAVADISLKTHDDGVLETQLYLADTTTSTVEAGLEHLCALPGTEGARRSGTLMDSTATREVRDIDCSDPGAVLETWRAQE